MKAAAASQPGQVLIADFPEPRPGSGDLVVETLACGICATDVKLVQKGAPELKYALGHEMTGRIVHAAPGGRWQAGELVVVAPYLPCGECYFCTHGQAALCPRLYEVFPLPGGLAQRILIPAPLAERGLFPVPAGLSPSTAALAEPLGCVLLGLQASHFAAGDVLLVVGDGPMGQLAAAAGRALGAQAVLVAGMTPHRLEVARAAFATETVDITTADLSAAVQAHTQGRGADVVLVAVSSGEALATGLAQVRAGGTVNAFAGVPDGTQLPLDVRRLHYQQYYLTGSSGTTPEYMARALQLLQEGKVDFSRVITASFPFERSGEAVAYVARQQGLKSMVTFN